MKHLQCIAVNLMLFLLLSSCGSHIPDYKKKLNVTLGPAPELSYNRYEEVLFSLDTAVFQQELKAIQGEYRPFLEGDLDNPEAVLYLKDFVTDPFSIELYDKVKEAFPDLSVVEAMVSEVYRHFLYYYPDIPLPKKVFTCVSGVNPETPSVMLFEDGLVISLDWYLNQDEVYDKMGMPQYRSQRTQVASLAKDLGVVLYQHYCQSVQEDHRQGNLLDEMVYAGKMYFFVEAMCPDIAEDVLLGYSPSQMCWATENEGNLWADMVGSQCLYTSDMEVFRTFLADGPFTNEYSHDAPARLGEFIGLHIVRSYADCHEVSLPELMREKDLQGIFLDSKYKPKKQS